MENFPTKPSSEILPSEEVLDEEPKPKPNSFTVLGGFQMVLSIAIVMATLLTMWNPRKLLGTPNINALVRQAILQNQESELLEEDTTSHIGILAGHWQDSPGEVCADGLVEAEVNQAIANRVGQSLTELGYAVDVFPEFDLALLNYRGAVLLAIYSGSCAESPLPLSGFKVASSLTAQNLETIDRLANCISENYKNATQLPFSFEVLNPDHPSYHIFRDIHSDTPAVLIEVGSLKTDRSVIVGQSDTVTGGIVSGILCFLNGQTQLE